jgi:hypothetical protein
MNRISHRKVELIPPDYRSGLPDDSILDLPPFNRWGYLPDGVHDACFESVLQRFATNPIRRTLCQRLQRFLLLVIDSKSCSHAYIAGGFTTAKSSPKDIDVILQTRAKYGPEAFRAMEPFFSIGLDTIYQKYSVHLHFWCEGFPHGICDFRDYFQCLRYEEASSLGITTGVKKGIVRIEL